MDKKDFSVKFMVIVFLVGCIASFSPVRADDIGAFIPGQGWVVQQNSCEGDSTPLQFIPKTGPDSDPLKDELKKYPRCVHCGMNRTMWHHSRHLVHYNDGLAVGTCSIRCLAVNLSLNIDRGVKQIWAADFSDKKNKPVKMVDADEAVYLIGSRLKGTMTMNSKMAFGTHDLAQQAMAEHGGTTASFDAALETAFDDMAKDTIMIRKRRAKKTESLKKKK
jgi:copper chaperone NosL